MDSTSQERNKKKTKATVGKMRVVRCECERRTQDAVWRGECEDGRGSCVVSVKSVVKGCAREEREDHQGVTCRHVLIKDLRTTTALVAAEVCLRMCVVHCA